MDIFETGDGPIWTNALAIIVGCLFGILIPKMILRGNSSTHGLNKISAKQVFLGSLDDDELEALVDGKVTLFEFKCRQIFKKLDKDNSNSLDKQEIREHFEESMGEKFDDEHFEKELKTHFNVSFDDKAEEYTFDEFKVIFKQMAENLLDERKRENDAKSVKSNGS